MLDRNGGDRFMIDAQGIVLRVSGLTVRYPGAGAHRQRRAAVEDVSFDIGAGEVCGLIGESGSGKSSLARGILQLGPARSGAVWLNGMPLHTLSGAALRRGRAPMQMVFQNPLDSLNPRLTISASLREHLMIRDPRLEAADRDRRIAGALELVGLAAASADRFPHEFSGGQLQRIAIARSVLVRPDILICDEAVSALDASIQAQILNLLADLRERFGMAILFISHDLAAVRHMCDRVLVLYHGRLIEDAPAETFFANPAPSPGAERGCAFAGQCPEATPICRAQRPHLESGGRGQAVACWNRQRP
jgi:ABC-type glutathione transport system ATPase component